VWNWKKKKMSIVAVCNVIFFLVRRTASTFLLLFSVPRVWGATRRSLCAKKKHKTVRVPSPHAFGTENSTFLYKIYTKMFFFQHNIGIKYSIYDSSSMTIYFLKYPHERKWQTSWMENLTSMILAVIQLFSFFFFCIDHDMLFFYWRFLRVRCVLFYYVGS